MRLRTLPVSLSGVVYACALAIDKGGFNLVVALLCLAFALLAQVSSNFANEYYDYAHGIDRAGRQGPRRGVTEGDISPRAMKHAAFATLGAAATVGCILVWLYGQWWMYPAGILIALGALAYSAGPWPLSRIGLGEVAVILFFGIVPVSLTYYLLTSAFSAVIFAASLGIGLMGANVLLVNNYRDRPDDTAVGKRTLAVRFGAKFALGLYIVNGFAAAALTLPQWLSLAAGWLAVPAAYLCLHIIIARQMSRRQGAALNPLLGITAMLMAAFSLCYLLAALAA